MSKQVERRKGARYTVSPFQLLINDGNYYLLAFDDFAQDMRTYRVDRFGTKDVQPARAEDTCFGVTAKVEISEQFFGWLPGFGRKAQLIYPATAVDEFRAYLNNVRDLYESC
jgi:predicted DNA-binding transcriptional regulator YafY